MSAPALMIQGVASSVGKSLLTAGLCRLYARRGVRVAPFKAQNMSNNAAVTSDGGEIGRAQALQARAAGRPPSVDMNPILLKPEHGGRSQVIVRGVATSRLSGRDYFERREALWPVVTEALARLREHADLLLIEGAGSPAEVNLRQWDIVNMRVAHHAEASVLLVADIDRGGALAALVGTLELLEPADRARVQGLIINRFRGDLTLLQPALTFLEERTGVRVLGVVPHVADLRLPTEDTAELEGARSAGSAADVVAVRLPRVSNVDDLDPLAAAGVPVRWISDVAHFGAPGLVVIPGSKSTRADLEFLWSSGLAAAIRAAASRGSLILGLCGGYQMLGEELVDPDGLEGPSGTTSGLGLLRVSTVFAPRKQTRLVTAHARADAGPLAGICSAPLQGYEIHDGVTHGSDAPLLAIRDGAHVRLDGAHDASGRIMGTYVHGLLHNGPVLHALLTWLGRQPTALSYETVIDQELDRLADTLEAHLDIDAIDALVGFGR